MNIPIQVTHMKHGLAYVAFDCYVDGRDVSAIAHYAAGHGEAHYPVPAIPLDVRWNGSIYHKQGGYWQLSQILDRWSNACSLRVLRTWG